MSALDAGIVEWVNTFELSSSCSSLSDLSDGVMLSEILLEISPDLFNIENIRRDVGHNWALKQTNLKKLLFHIETFYRENLRQNTEFSSSIDLLGVAKNASPEGIRALVQLLVGAAVSCNEKADFIEAMMQMSDNGQTVMQQIVQESMAGMQVAKSWEAEEEEHGGSAMSRSGLEREEEMSSGMGGARGMGGRGQQPGKGRGRGISPLARSVSSEQREEEWALRLAEAEESIAALAKERDEEASSRGGLEKEVENLKEKLDEMEAHALARNARDEEATNMSLSLQRLLSSLEDKEEELQQALQKTSVMELKLDQETEMRMDKELELRKLADELDIAKAKASQFAKMEATLEKYQRRFEEMEDLQLQNKQLDELNTKYLDQMLKLESTAKTIPNLKKKIEQYKNQAVELERQNFDVTSALALKDADIQRLREELEAATQARNFFEDELIALRDQNKAHAEVLEEDASMHITGGLFAGAASRAEMKEKVARQEQEIALLKAQIADGGVEGGDGLSRVEVLESQLELARRVKDERSAEALAAKRNAADLEQKNHKLEQMVSELKGAPQSAAQAEKSTTKIREMKEEMERLRSLAQDRERLRMTAQSLEDRLKQRETQVNNLQTDKEKLESYTKETLHTFQDKYMVAIAHCKMQLAEKNEKIDYLESKITRDKAASKREERLLMSTVYELGMDTIEKQLRSSVTELVRGVETDSSWIRKQRAQLKRTNPLAPP